MTRGVISCDPSTPRASLLKASTTLRAGFELAAKGTYQPVLLASTEPLPEPSGGLDVDAGAAMRAGVTVVLPSAIEVR